MNNELCVAYALTTNFRDRYSAMASLSIASLRTYNPGVKVAVFADEDTYAHLDKTTLRKPLDSCAWIKVVTPGGPASFRNRYVKASLRDLIQGPFVYLDADTLTRSAWLKVVASSSDIAGINNHHGSPVCPRIESADKTILQQMGESADFDSYLNGGVLYINDTEQAHKTCLHWKNLILDSHRRFGICRDQALLNIAIRRSCATVQMLDPRLNAQIFAAPRTAYGAWIWHFFDSCSLGCTYFDLEVARLMSGGDISEQRLRAVAERKTPWILNHPIDWLLISLINKHGYAHPKYTSVLGLGFGDAVKRFWDTFLR